MKNNELIHYLNSGVKGIGKNGCIYTLSGIDNNKPYLIGKDSCFSFEYSENFFTTYLYHLSCLTETINHEGKDEIPLVELAKIEGTYKGEEYEFVRDILVWLNSDNKEILFRYSPTYHSFYKTINGNLYQSTFQLSLFQYLFSRRINVFGIEAIDPRELGDNNPYLITKK